jgi:hypothetical protein
MANFVFNISKGKTREYHDRVDNNDPANSALIIMVLAATGLETDAVLKDLDTFSAIVAGTTNEVTNTNYARKTLTDADLTASSVDDTNDWALLPFPTQTFTSIAAGDSWSKLVIGYDSDTTGGTDANIVPVAAYDLRISGSVVVPSGANIVVSATNGYIRAR